MPYHQRAVRYAQRVIAGEIVACKLTRLACERFIRDLARTDWQWRFDEALAARACGFIEHLPHIKGQWARQRLKIELQDWQVFIVCNLFGWVDRETGLRRFITCYLEVARKNAKSTLAAGIGLYMLAADGEPGAEVYSAATTGDQARIVFDVARQMVLREHDFVRGGIDPQRHGLYMPNDARKFEPLNAEGSTLDGLNPHCTIIDELHAHKRRDVYDVLDTARGARDQSLLASITTAGSDRAGICYEQRTYIVKVLEGVFQDERYFGLIYTIDDDDDWTKPDCWAKANPNYNVSVYPDDIKRLADKAMRVPSARSNFLTKRLNKWVAAADAWMDMLAWDRCADPTLKPEQFIEDPCWIPLDLASKKDIAEKGTLFARNIDGRDHYFYFGTHYLPELAATDESNSQYAGWVQEGWLKTTPGNITDYDVIEEDIKADVDRYNVIEVPYDPHQATQLSTHLMAEGIEMVEVKPTVLNFSEPMKEFEALVIDGRFHHNGDPVLTWMVGNIVAFRDAKDNIYPRKESEEKKIDGGVAIIMGLARAITGERKQSHSGELMVV